MEVIILHANENQFKQQNTICGYRNKKIITRVHFTECNEGKPSWNASFMILDKLKVGKCIT